MVTAIDLIIEERIEQIKKHGYDAEHDDKEGVINLAAAGMAYTAYVCGYGGPFYWPWNEGSFKPRDGNIYNLIKAGALIVAAIEVELRTYNVNEEN